MRRLIIGALWLALGLGAGSVFGGTEEASRGLADPTRPSTSSGGRKEGALGSTRLSVEEVLTRAGVSIAIVNGRVVHVGDRVAGIFIQEITPRGIRYSRQGQQEFAPVAQPKLDLRELRANNKHP